ncbi:MAG: restriction endonuclease [Beijerinckiaceae bacterium]
METHRIWGVRAGNAGQADHIFIEHDQIALSFIEAGGDASLLPPSRGAFKEAFSRNGAAKACSVPIQAGQLYRFVHEMRIGDRVIYPRKCDRTLRWGEVVGPYVYDVQGASEFAHRRSVRWAARLSRDEFTQGALYELGSTLALFEVKSYSEEFLRRFESGAGPAEEDVEENVVRDIAETTRDYIARKLRLHFKGFAAEALIADLFCAMGYKAHVTRRYRDDGVDVIAHRDELGIEPPILKIQVKTNEANIGADAVKAFYAMVEDRDVGVFVTTGGFSSSALDFARNRGNLKLVAGVELIGLIQKHYDRLSAHNRQQIPLRRVLAPDLPEPEAA